MARGGAPADGATPSGYLVVATIRRPHGVRGELALALETDRPQLVFRAGRRLMLGDARGRPTGQSLTIQRARPVPGGMLLKVAEFDGLTPEVEGLRGRSLLMEAEQAAPAGQDELHYRDLLDSTLVVGGDLVGVIRQITTTAAGELLVVHRGGGRELLVPFVREWIRGFDREGKRLVMEPPPGLLEL